MYGRGDACGDPLSGMPFKRNGKQGAVTLGPPRDIGRWRDGPATVAATPEGKIFRLTQLRFRRTRGGSDKCVSRGVHTAQGYPRPVPGLVTDLSVASR